MLLVAAASIAAESGAPATQYYDFYCRDNQTIRHGRIVAEDATTYTIKLDLITEPLRIAKHDMLRPPVPLKAAEPKILPGGEEDKKIVPAAEPVAKTTPVKDASPKWGQYSLGLGGIVALREIRGFKTYGYGAFFQYTMRDIFSDRIRLFGRLGANQVTSENYDFLYVPVVAGTNFSLYEFGPGFSLYAEAAVGLAYRYLTTREAEKSSAVFSASAAAGLMYFPVKYVSLNLELAGVLVGLDHAAGNTLRLQLMAVGHL